MEFIELHLVSIKQCHSLIPKCYSRGNLTLFLHKFSFSVLHCIELLCYIPSFYPVQVHKFTQIESQQAEVV